MNDTLESIRPSGSQRELSYIYSRDPSILAYGQIALPSDDSKKNLESVFEDESIDSSRPCSSIPSLSVLGDTMKVYLRLRPFTSKTKLTQQQQEAYKILDSNTLLTKLPSLDNNTSSLKRPKGSDTVSRKFTFTHTFGPETTQLQLFEQAVKQHMVDFLNGRSATVMSYGTTNAGKSFTLQGTTESPGIIPRGLEFVFSNIEPRPTPCYKPLYNTDIVSLDANSRAYEMELKTKLLSFGSIDKNHYVQAYRSMQQLLRHESPLKPTNTSDANYSVWVSFAEIYNETIYDLLSNDCQKKRPALKLATDTTSKKAFIRDLKMVCVNSGSEAYQLLMLGQHNLKVAATALNARSSRSHCIFTIKLLKYHKENTPSEVEVSTFSFCDLAGSERLKKTLNAGDRLKEAQNINTSLLVLGRCLKSIFEVQSSKMKNEIVGPFRESKLTRLFQSALSGKEHIALIVNVNPVPNLYTETQNVLNFSAIAKQIVIEPVVRVKRRASLTRFSQMVSQSITTVTDWDLVDLESIGEEESCSNTDKTEYIHVDDYAEILRENSMLKKEVVQLKNSAFNIDFEIRKEMSNMYTAMIEKLETNFKNRLQDAEAQQEDMLEWSVKQVEQYYKDKLDKVSNRKRSRLDTGDESDEDVNIAELEAENVQLNSKVETLKQTVKELREFKEKIMIEHNNTVFELSLVKKDCDNLKSLLAAAQSNIGCDSNAKEVIEEQEKQLAARDEQIKTLKTYLNEAKTEWLALNQVYEAVQASDKKKDAEIVVLLDKIEDLTEQVEQTNVCLAESTGLVESLEDSLDAQIKKQAQTEESLENVKDQWNKSNAKFLVVSTENEDLKKQNEAHLVTVREQALEIERLSKALADVTTKESESRLEIDSKNEMLITLSSKLTLSEEENASLKQSLAQSNDHTKTLREELNSTKSTLGDISDQINVLKVAKLGKAATANAEMQTSFVNDETEETETLVVVKVETSEEEKSAIISNIDFETKEKLEQLTIEYDDLKTRYSSEIRRVEELTKELKEAKEESSMCKTSLVDVAEKNTQYKESLRLVQKELRFAEEDLVRLAENMTEMEKVTEVLKNQLSESEESVEKLQTELEESRNRLAEKSEALKESSNRVETLEAELSEAVEKLEENSDKCLREHTSRIGELEKEISAAAERHSIKEQLLDAHYQKINELEKELEELGESRERISVVENELKQSRDERSKLETRLKENLEQISSLEGKLQTSINREQEKDNEITTLQQEMKNIIQTTTNDIKKDADMEKEVKNLLRDLTEAQKSLEASESELKSLEKSTQAKIACLEMQIQTFERNASYLALLQEGAEKKVAETERLNHKNAELQQEIEQKNQELESFKKNRNETIQRYETLVKQLQDELDRSKREVMRYQELFLRQSTPTPRKEEIRKLKDDLRSMSSLLEQAHTKLKKSESMREEKENMLNTSEDEAATTDVRRTGRRQAQTPRAALNPNDISVIELSGSESKRVTRRTALPPPTAVPPEKSEQKKSRRKKLFQTTEDSRADIDPTETPPSRILRSPLTATRSLRTRRK